MSYYRRPARKRGWLGAILFCSLLFCCGGPMLLGAIFSINNPQPPKAVVEEPEIVKEEEPKPQIAKKEEDHRIKEVVHKPDPHEEKMECR